MSHDSGVFGDPTMTGGAASVAVAEGVIDLSDVDGSTLLVEFSGDWLVHGALPSIEEIDGALEARPSLRTIRFDTKALGEWDSALLMILVRILEQAGTRQIAVERDGLPEGVRRLLTLAEAVPEKKDARTETLEQPLLDRIGLSTIRASVSLMDSVRFLGDIAIAFGKLTRARARFRRSDLLLLIQQAGADALPIVGLVSFLIGLILAFVGAIQLQAFGASIFVADLVGIAMVRDIGALMTGIVMTGRSGAAYAAQLASMKVNQEIDALTTLGVSPLEFLVLPRVIALSLMMPLLVVYSDLVGILGGALVGVTMLDLSILEYMQQTARAVSVEHLLGGLFKGTVYGVLIAIGGSLRGMEAARSSSGVGDATTSAVVSGIVSIIGAAGLFAFLFYLLGL